MEFSHKSVLLEETIEGLAIKPEGIYVDGTLGGAGHSSVIAGRLSGQGHLIGIDQDAAAIAAATERLQPFAEHVTIVRSNYENMCQIIKDNGYAGVDGILLDLGVSSYQLDTVERGFSYKYDTKLDMRMDERQTLTARDIVNGYSETELFHIIRDYGEDKFAKNIAKHIVLAREEKPIETTYELNEIIKAAIPSSPFETYLVPNACAFPVPFHLHLIRLALEPRPASGDPRKLRFLIDQIHRLASLVKLGFRDEFHDILFTLLVDLIRRDLYHYLFHFIHLYPMRSSIATSSSLLK